MVSVSGNNHIDFSARTILHNRDRLTSPHISAVITFHREGTMAAWTLEDMHRARKHLDDANLSMELICVLDLPDADTCRIVTNHSILRPYDVVLQVNNGDLGTSRNDGFSVARGTYGGTMDGDDYYSSNWLAEAYKRACQFDAPVVVHPDFLLSFGSVNCVQQFNDQTLNDYPITSCIKIHPWCSCSFAPLRVYRSVPYQRTDVRETGFGYEDWHWNLETIAHGIRHVTAPKTALFYRRKEISMQTEMQRFGAVIPPSQFFDNPEDWLAAG
jgi:glycosyltransferase involved in cell wall biosynthesis